jgi:hypothetical protein
MKLTARPIVITSLLTLGLAGAVMAASCTGVIDPAAGGGGGGSDGGAPGRRGDASRDGKTSRSEGGADGQAGPPAYPFQPIDTGSAVSKVKNLLIGSPATDQEVSAVATGLADAGAGGATAALKQLITTWTTPPAGQTTLTPANLSLYQAKMLSFLSTTFQQTQVTSASFTALNGNFAGQGLTQNLLLANLQQMFALTVLQLMANGGSFADAANTQQFMMTPAMMAYYAAVDAQITDDSGGLEDLTLKADPAFSFKLTGKGTMADYPISEAVNSSSPNYLTFFSPFLSSTSTGASDLTPAEWATCLAADPWVLTNSNTMNERVTDAVLSTIFGDPQAFAFVLHPPGDAGATTPCSPSTPYATYNQTFNSGGFYIQPSDFSSWSLVTIRQPTPGEPTTRFYDLPTLRKPNVDLVLYTPRVGFFTTQAFFAGWATNASNQARVTMNQTMIVGLGHTFNGTDNINLSSISLAAVDSEHAPSNSACYFCHQTLDPMRQFFRQAYSLDFSEQTDASEIALPGQFAFQGQSQGGNNTIIDLATLIKGHKDFAGAWVQKLCTYATSAVCDETDPEFSRIVSVFQTSNYSWSTLVSELFSSPIVTYLTETASSDQQGETFPITREGHLCAMLSERLKIPDVCGLLPTTVVTGNLSTVQQIAAALPSDQYSRGSVVPVLANNPSLFFRSGLENICVALANTIIDNAALDGGGYASTEADAAINDFVHNLMGLTTERAGGPDSGPLGILLGHFASANGAKFDGGAAINSSEALKSTFILACESPYVAGMGQ